MNELQMFLMVVLIPLMVLAGTVVGLYIGAEIVELIQS